MFNKKSRSETDKTADLNSAMKFEVVESYKAVRANLGFALPEETGCKTILFTSPEAAEGKTTTCVNIAITLAQSGLRVLVLDCDMRKPRVHRMLGIKNQQGMSNVLSRMCSIEEVIRDSGKDNLKFVTAGPIPPNPAELLAGPMFKETLDSVAGSFDYVLIDTPPVTIVSDALPPSKQCGGVVLVVMHRKSRHPAVKDALDKLKFAGANVLGIVLNGIKLDESPGRYVKYSKYGRYGKYSRYGKGYGYIYKNSEKDDDKDDTNV